MNYIDFVVRNKHIESRHNSIIADNTDYVFRFTFLGKWTEFETKTVLMLREDGKFYRCDMNDGATSLMLPKFTSPLTLLIGVTAGSGEVEISTDRLLFNVRSSIRTGANEELEKPESGAEDFLAEYCRRYDELLLKLETLDDVYILPSVTSADAGKVLRVSAAGEWEAADAASGAVNNRFIGKNANFLGDSQTDDAGNYKSVFFYDWLKDILGLSATNNYGYSGTTIMPIEGQTRSFLERYTSMSDDADLIVVWGGTNDYQYGHALGEVDDTANTTFCGALNNLCKGLIAKYPKKDILFVTPTPRGNLSTAVATQKDYADAIIDVCAKYCIPVFDAFRKCNMPIIVDSDRVYTADGLHLNDLGHEILGKSMANFILYSEMAGAQKSFQSVTVTNVSLDKSSASVEVGSTVQLTATVEPSDASNKTVVWSTSNADVATVENGLVTGVADGTATITAKTVSGNKTATCVVTVGDGQGETSVSVTGVTLDKTAHSLDVGESVQLTASVIPAYATNQNVSWSASNENCTVENGLITAVAAGDCTITATTVDGGFTATCVVTVSEPAADAPTSPVDGKTVTFTAQGSWPAATNLTLLVNAADIPSYENGHVLSVRMVVSNATKTISAFGNGMQIFTDETGEVNNGKFKTGISAYVTSTLDGNEIVATANMKNTQPDFAYVKIPVSITVGEYPVSFKIVSLTADINGTYIPIQTVGGFYAVEGFSMSD